jgi:serine/threonine protein kinase/Tol biopolymer transport system component
MKRDRWEQIERLYHAALEIEPGGREAFLDEACAGDEDLRREVAELLACDVPDDSFIQSPAIEIAARAMAGDPLIEASSKSMESPSVGSQISAYQLLSPLGRGGMGEVYLALDTRLGRKVAVKLLPTAFTTDADRAQRFALEARAASALNHPNIITVHEIGEAATENGSLRYIVTEYVEGETLRQRMESLPQRRMMPLEAIDIAMQIAAALSAAHDAGITHRDIKPENVMIRRDGIVKVLDFGLAKLTESASPVIDSRATTMARNITGAGVVMGTPRYMSPEQARGERVDARTDIFSLGVALYEMIAGRAPFAGATPAEVSAAILRDSPPPLVECAPDAPPEMERILDNALRKDREERYRTVKELLGDLKDLIEERAFESRLERSLVSVSNELEAGNGSQVQRKPWQEFLRRHVAAAVNLALHGQRPRPLREFLRRHKVAVVALSVVLSLGIVRGGAWLFGLMSYPPHPNPAQMRFTQFEAVREQELSTIFDARFSPDGRLVAYAHTADGRNIWVKQANGGLPHRVTTGQWLDFSPIWSPTGERIAFISNRGDQFGVWTVPFLGGVVEPVKILGDYSMEIQGGGPPRLKSWARDGRTIYYEWSNNLYSIDLSTPDKASNQLTHFELGNQKPREFSLGPDEKWIAYRGDDQNIWRMQAPSGMPAQVTRDQADNRYPIWHPEGKYLIYNSFRDGRSPIMLTDLSAGSTTSLTASDYSDALVDISPDGNQLLCYGYRYESDLFAVAIETGEEDKLTDNLGVEFSPSVSHRGDTIAFQSIPGERFDWNRRKGLLITKSLVTPEQPRQLAKDAFAVEWAPSGEMLAFLRMIDRSCSLWTVSASGGIERQLVRAGVTYAGRGADVTADRLQSADISWAPDSSRIAYCARESDISNVYVIAADGSHNTRISANVNKDWVINCPLWSPSGDQIAFVLHSGGSLPLDKQFWELWVSKEGQAKMIYHTEAVLRLLDWTSDDELVAGLVANDDFNRVTPKEVQLISISAKAPRSRLMNKLPRARQFSVRLSPDKRDVSFVAKPGGMENIFLLSLRRGQSRQITQNNDEKTHYSSPVWASDGKSIYFGKQTRWSLLTLIDNLK